VVTAALRAVNVTPGDGDRAIEDMKAAGAAVATSEELLKAPQA
jgi:hypothetical protein